MGRLRPPAGASPSLAGGRPSAVSTGPASFASSAALGSAGPASSPAGSTVDRAKWNGGADSNPTREELLLAEGRRAPTRLIDGARIELPANSSGEPVVVWAPRANAWMEGSREVMTFPDGLRLTQGRSEARGKRGVLWIDHRSDSGVTQVIGYLEGDVMVAGEASRLSDQEFVAEWVSRAPIDYRMGSVAREDASGTALFARAKSRRDDQKGPRMRLTKVSQELERRLDPLPSIAPEGTPTELLRSEALEEIQPGRRTEALPPAAPAPGGRRIRALPRSSQPFQIDSRKHPETGEQVTVVTNGVNLLIDGVEVQGQTSPVDLAADRVVIWSQGGLDLTGKNATEEGKRVEVYLEGNIVFRQGDRVVYADRMFYDVSAETGTVVNAEMFTNLPGFLGPLRVRADVIRQEGRDRFTARNAWFSTSQLAQPRYRWQAGELYFEDRQLPLYDGFTGQPVADPRSGQQVVVHEQNIASWNNSLYVESVPIFYWPYIAGSPQDANYFPKLSFGNDRVFGAQVKAEFDGYKLLGLQAPTGHRWEINLDYLGKRGLGHGMGYSYIPPTVPGGAPPPIGVWDFWGINDHGLDNLGAGRTSIQPDYDYTFRLFGRHRQRFENGVQLTAEAGYINERNFLEQYFENEWDTFKDETTGIELRQILDESSWSVWADIQVNDFMTQSSWLPRADHFWLGKSLPLGISWFEHTQAAYVDYGAASTPTSPEDLANFTRRPYEVDSKGERFATRHELDLPFTVGGLNFVPYALGEYAHWGEVLSGDKLDRLYGQAGLRASLPIWGADPEIESNLLNVHGLAHKMVFTVDAFHAQADQSADDFPLYDPIDDDSQEHFRRRFPTLTFGGVLPPQFDERQYAIRSGIGSYVAGPSVEMADDLDAVRMGLNQRWQTKRGPAENRHIVDWLTLDAGVTYYPNPGRDNFGENFGLLTYDAIWHPGDRVSVFSSGTFDFFEEGQKIVTVGANLARPPRGNLSAAFHWIDGAVQSQILTSGYEYQMSQKWAVGYGFFHDFAANGFTGHNLVVSRLGESFVTQMGFVYNSSKNNFGFVFSLQPRFLRVAGASAFSRPFIPTPGSNTID